jgi:hypothetical protein
MYSGSSLPYAEGPEVQLGGRAFGKEDHHSAEMSQ